MALIEHRGGTTDDDRGAIAELHEAVDRQRVAFRREPYPSLQERRGHLEALAGMLLANRARIQEAMSADFGVHPTQATDLIEVLGVAGRAAYAAERVEQWMAFEPREADPAMWGSARATMRPQPKGVVGCIVPWNFPFDLSVGPLVEMLAAGNRAVIKPSEYTPACGALLQEMLRATFDRDRVDVVLGGVELARAFSRVRWDHLLYTGNPEVGREVAKAAAEQLVPVTLELGGKCPALLAPGSVDAEAVRHIVGAKGLKNGQMCTNVDYCLVPRDELDAFVDLATEQIRDGALAFAESGGRTGIITERHLERLGELLGEARAAGCDVRTPEGDGPPEPGTRQLPLSLVVDPPEDSRLMREEVFGPILPIKPYDRLDEAIDHVNAGERPLALYVFARDEDVAEDVLRRTTSGGASVNTIAAHSALPSLPFGGTGQSGSGRHHGLEGFREFSNLRGVFVRGEGDVIDAFMPPYGPLADAVIAAALDDGE